MEDYKVTMTPIERVRCALAMINSGYDCDLASDCAREDVAELLRAYDNLMPKNELVRHVRLGTIYAVVGEAKLHTVHTAESQRPFTDMAPLTIYRASDGSLHARLSTEFRDGRFEALSDEA